MTSASEVNPQKSCAQPFVSVTKHLTQIAISVFFVNGRLLRYLLSFLWTSTMSGRSASINTRGLERTSDPGAATTFITEGTNGVDAKMISSGSSESARQSVGLGGDYLRSRLLTTQSRIQCVFYSRAYHPCLIVYLFCDSVLASILAIVIYQCWWKI